MNAPRRSSNARDAAPSAVAPPVEPMLAKLADEVPEGDFLYEPKWDGFRALVFRSADDLFIQSRDLRPLTRYFPELQAELETALPTGCVLDGEIVIVGPSGLDFDARQLRLHPAESRVQKLAREMPASFVAFDALAIDNTDLRQQPQQVRRNALENVPRNARPPLYLTPMTRDRAQALRWLGEFEGRRTGRSHRKARAARLPAGQAGTGQGQARAHGRLRGRGLEAARGRTQLLASRMRVARR